MNKKRYLLGIFAMLLVLVGGLLSGCGKDSGNSASAAASSSVVYVFSEEGETEPVTGETSAVQTESVSEEDLGTDMTADSTEEPDQVKEQYYFRNEKLLGQHYEKHGIEMGFASEEEYEAAASDVINNPDALHKKESEDNDEVYYVEDTNEFVVLSSDGYIRTYFNPSAGIDYYNRQ